MFADRKAQSRRKEMGMPRSRPLSTTHTMQKKDRTATDFPLPRYLSTRWVGSPGEHGHKSNSKIKCRAGPIQVGTRSPPFPSPVPPPPPSSFPPSPVSPRRSPGQLAFPCCVCMYATTSRRQSTRLQRNATRTNRSGSDYGLRKQKKHERPRKTRSRDVKREARLAMERREKKKMRNHRPGSCAPTPKRPGPPY